MGVQAEARGSLQVLLAIRDANPASELRSWWQGANYAAWRGVKVQHGEVVELCAPGGLVPAAAVTCTSAGADVWSARRRWLQC